MANVLSGVKRVAVVQALCEGNSLRATSRMCDVSRNTISKLLMELGIACAQFQDRELRDLPCKRIEVDEIWSFVYAKAKNVPQERKGEFGVGDIWTFTAIDADTKLCVAWLMALRDAHCATEFMLDIRQRCKGRLQITSDGHGMYLGAVDAAFGTAVDYAMLQKVYGSVQESETRYSPAVVKGTVRERITGNPDPRYVSTSYVERQNLTMRMSMRRFTRLTNAFSKKLDYHAAAVSLHFAYYNWCRVHQTTRITPAMAAGLATKPWKVENLLALLPPVQYSGGRGRKKVSK